MNVDKPAWATRLVNILATLTSDRWNINSLDFGALLNRLHSINVTLKDIGTLWEEVVQKCGRGRNDIWDKATQLDAIALGCDCLPHLTHPCGHLRMEIVFSVLERTPNGSLDVATAMSLLTLLHRAVVRRSLTLRNAFRSERFSITFLSCLALIGAKHLQDEVPFHEDASRHVRSMEQHAESYLSLDLWSTVITCNLLAKEDVDHLASHQDISCAADATLFILGHEKARRT